MPARAGYGKSAGNLEIDPTARRQPNDSLKKAAPGAPFGWTTEGTPYIGTQYCIRGTTDFCSLSTRNGAARYFWRSIGNLTSRVAMSAME